MKTRFALVAPLLLAAVCCLSVPNMADCQEETPKNEVLARFVGVWEIQSTLKPAKWHPDGGEFTGKESTVWALKNRIILIRDVSQPDGKKGLFIATHDPKQDAYPFWGFDSAGLLGGEWLLKWNAEARTTVGRATDLPRAWTSGGKNHFPDADTNNVSYWMRDENGELLLEGTGRKDRLPADREEAIVAEWKKHEPPGDLPDELKVLERMIGDWDAVTVQRPAEWTPAGGRITAKVHREWALNGRFLLDTSLNSDGQESLSLVGYDPGQMDYRSWWFNSEGHRSTSRGQWNSATRTMTYQSHLEDGISMQSSVRFADVDREVWQFKATDRAGKVYLDMEITATRQGTNEKATP